MERPDRPASLPGHLRLVERIGAGGSAQVWRARDRRAGLDVAVKVIELDPDGAPSVAADRFEREVRALARLGEHPGVVGVRAAGVGEDGRAWIVTELVAGGTLADRVAAAADPDGGAGADDLVRWGSELAAALAHAHGLGVVHGDVTPPNVLLDADGAARLVDFGLAVVQAGAEVDGARTPGYAAPERAGAAGRPPVAPTAASDVFGLGATLWAAATGAPPTVPGGPGDPALPRGVDAILAACCRADPTARPTAGELVRLWGAEGDRRASLRS